MGLLKEPVALSKICYEPALLRRITIENLNLTCMDYNIKMKVLSVDQVIVTTLTNPLLYLTLTVQDSSAVRIFR